MSDSIDNVFKIGIDFGGVLSSKSINQNGAEHINTCIDMPFAIENLLKLKSHGHKLFLISFCGRTRAVETNKSLQNTMISENQSCASIFDGIYFVKDTTYKRQLCEYLSCHFMVDDREDILFEVQKRSSKTIPILFGQQNHTKFTSAFDWNIVTAIIESSPNFKIELIVEKPLKLLHLI